MKTSPVLLLTILVVGCHFDKLFNDSSGGAASRGGPAPPTATHLIFITEPSNTPPGTIITPPVRVAAVDDQDQIVTGFSGTISIAIGHNGSLLNPHLSGTTNDVPVVNGVATFPDLSIKIEDILQEGNKVVVRSTISGTQKGPFLGYPAKNRKMTIQAVDIHEVKDGKIIQTWHTEDWMTGFHQLGILEK